jgi:transcriptional regulator with XRE-family HTH domain
MEIVEEDQAEAGGVGVRSALAGDGEREPHPSDSLRTFGAFVQALREHAGLSRADLGTLVRYSTHTVQSVELGRRMPDEAFVERAEEALGNTGALRNAARHLTRGEAGLAAWFRRWARLEREALSLCTYECRLVPGLLQSETYARAVFDNSIPLLTDEHAETQLVARMKRQTILSERPTVPFSFIVEESVFRRRLGGVQVQSSMLGVAAGVHHIFRRFAPLEEPDNGGQPEADTSAWARSPSPTTRRGSSRRSKASA